MATLGIAAARHWVLIGNFCLSSFLGGCATTQALTGDEVRALSVASRRGVSAIPDRIRVRVVADRALTDLMEAALLARRPVPPDFTTAVAVWWLSDSGRPEYLSTLLHFSADTGWDTATFAIYGLMRHLGNESVRARLLEVDASAPPAVRNNMAVLLTKVNDAHARALLARLNHKALSSDVVQRIERALSTPPDTAGHVRWPCLKSALKARTASCTE